MFFNSHIIKSMALGLLATIMVSSCEELFEEAITVHTEPEIKTLDAGHIGSNSAELRSVLVSNGNDSITDIGFYWSESYNTKSTDNVAESEAQNDSVYTMVLDNLESGKTYYYKAYAINSRGKDVGEIKQFTTK